MYPLGRKPSVKKSQTAAIISCETMSQQCVQKMPVKPSGPGALSADKEKVASHISSLVGISNSKKLSSSETRCKQATPQRQCNSQ